MVFFSSVPLAQEVWTVGFWWVLPRIHWWNSSPAKRKTCLQSRFFFYWDFDVSITVSDVMLQNAHKGDGNPATVSWGTCTRGQLANLNKLANITVQLKRVFITEMTQMIDRMSIILKYLENSQFSFCIFGVFKAPLAQIIESFGTFTLLKCNQTRRCCHDKPNSHFIASSFKNVQKPYRSPVNLKTV